MPTPAMLLLPDEVRTRLVALHDRIGARLPQIAARIAERARVAAGERDPDERLAELVLAWMRSGLRGPHDDRFRTLRGRVVARYANLLPGAAYASLGWMRDAYRRAIGEHDADRESRELLDAVDRLLDLERELLLVYERARRERMRDRDLVAERLSAIRTLAAGFAHEVRNPLNSAKLQLEVLDRRLRRELGDDRFSVPSELARSEIEKLSALLDELLAFATPAALELVEHDVMAIAHAAIAAQRAEAERRGIELVLAGPETVVADIDVARMRTILQHLLANGIEAVDHDGSIRMVVRADESRIHVEVVDDGPGIPGELGTRIFDPFFTTKGACTGLGMSIVHSLVALHGGSVDVQSEPGRTAVAISIPRRAR